MSVSGIGSSFDSTQMAQQFFKKADTNGDDAIDKDELKTAISQGKGKGNDSVDIDKIFAEVDTNGNGKIDESENENHLKQMKAGHGGMPPSGAPKQANSSSSDYKTYEPEDLNKDGTVSAQEKLEYSLTHPESEDNENSSGYSQSGNLNAGSITNMLDLQA